MDVLKTLSGEDVDKLLYYLKPRGPRNYAMILTLLWTGLRVSELCNLIIDDIMISGAVKRVLIVRKDIAKNSTQREIPLSPSLQKTLSELLVWVETKRGPLDSGWPVFQQYDRPAPITPRQVERILRTAGGNALGRRVWPHMLRHTFATNLLKVSNTPIVQQILGHKNLASTQIYVHPSADDRVDAIGRMESGKV
jgi:integrase/recombinase XerD